MKKISKDRNNYIVGCLGLVQLGDYIRFVVEELDSLVTVGPTKIRNRKTRKKERKMCIEQTTDRQR